MFHCRAWWLLQCKQYLNIRIQCYYTALLHLSLQGQYLSTSYFMKICGRDKLNITCCKTAGTFCNLNKEIEQGRMCYLSNETWVHISSQGNPDKYRRPLGNMLFNLHSRQIKVSCVLYDRCFERLIYRDLSQHIYYTQMKSLQHQHFLCRRKLRILLPKWHYQSPFM